MIKRAELFKIMDEKGATLYDLAKVTKKSKRKLESDLANGIMSKTDINRIVDYLNIENPGAVFYAGE